MSLITKLMINNRNYYLQAIIVRIIRTQKLKFLINKNYSMLTSINKKKITNLLGNFFSSSTEHKQLVNKKNNSFLAHVNKNQNVEIDHSVSRRGEGKLMKYVTLSYIPLEPAMPIYITFFTKNNF